MCRSNSYAMKGFGIMIGVQIDPMIYITTFILEDAMYLMDRLEVGRDRKTAYERVRGKKATVLGIEVGEKLLYE